MPQYKLTYFDVRGRAELLRLLFVYAEVQFDDHRINYEEFSQLKASGKAPFGQVPILEVDGKVAAQTMALSNYLAREFGVYGSNSWENLMIDMINCQLEDLRNAGAKVFHEKDEEKKKELMKKFTEEDLPRYLGGLTKILKANGGTYFVGNTWTLADIAVYDTMWNGNSRINGFVEPYPELKAHMEAVGNIPQIKKYVDARKETPV